MQDSLKAKLKKSEKLLRNVLELKVHSSLLFRHRLTEATYLNWPLVVKI